MLPSDAQFTVGRAVKRLDEPRATHWWDGDDILAHAYAPVLGIEGEAWDVYLLYDKDAVWGDTPPKPVFWQEQLGISDETQLNREKLTAEARKLLAGGK